MTLINIMIHTCVFLENFLYIIDNAKNVVILDSLLTSFKFGIYISVLHHLNCKSSVYILPIIKNFSYKFRLTF